MSPREPVQRDNETWGEFHDRQSRWLLAQWRRIHKPAKLPTLRELIGDAWPTCVCCARRLKPHSLWITAKGLLAHPPSKSDFDTGRVEVLFGTGGFLEKYSPNQVYRAHRYISLGIDTGQTTFRFWTGTYDGYAVRGRRNAPLFCSTGCGISFGAAAWCAGYKYPK
jgi:hypothetical protein